MADIVTSPTVSGIIEARSPPPASAEAAAEAEAAGEPEAAPDAPGEPATDGAALVAGDVPTEAGAPDEVAGLHATTATASRKRVGAVNRSLVVMRNLRLM